MVLILLGPPGVGKGTQGATLTEDLGWERIATGDLLRSARDTGTDLGRAAQEYMDRGDLVPDELIVALVREHLRELDEATSVIFDGFPRTVPQAEALDAVLEDVGRRVDGVLLLTAPDDVLVKRVSGRRSCTECGRLYNVFFDPPNVEGVCDVCGGNLVHRDDDDPETVAHRLEVYREQTEPLVKYYEHTEARVIAVDGDRTMDEVRVAIHDALARELDVRMEGA